MPKIIDHDTHRLNLARKAVPLFSQHGYSGLGMRKIAAELGVSKSALYHYFPTKKDLFLACTAAAVTRPPASSAISTTSQEEQIDALINEAKPGFAGEMSLLFDYLRGMTPDQIAADPAMCMAMDAFIEQVANIVGKDQAPETFSRIIGGLMLNHFTGGKWSMDKQRLIGKK